MTQVEVDAIVVLSLNSFKVPKKSLKADVR